MVKLEKNKKGAVYIQFGLPPNPIGSGKRKKQSPAILKELWNRKKNEKGN